MPSVDFAGRLRRPALAALLAAPLLASAHVDTDGSFSLDAVAQAQTLQGHGVLHDLGDDLGATWDERAQGAPGAAARAWGIEGLPPSSSQIPEPATVVLTLVGLGAVALGLVVHR